MSAVQDIFLATGIELVELDNACAGDDIELLVSGKAIAVGPEGMRIVPPRDHTVITTSAGTLVIF